MCEHKTNNVVQYTRCKAHCENHKICLIYTFDFCCTDRRHKHKHIQTQTHEILHTYTKCNFIDRTRLDNMPGRVKRGNKRTFNDTDSRPVSKPNKYFVFLAARRFVVFNFLVDLFVCLFSPLFIMYNWRLISNIFRFNPIVIYHSFDTVSLFLFRSRARLPVRSIVCRACSHFHAFSICFAFSIAFQRQWKTHEKNNLQQQQTQ